MSTILLVDSDFDCRAIFRSALAYDGYRILESEDGDGALAALAEEPVRLVIGELYVRCENGELFLPALKTHPAARSLSVVVVSTRGFDDARVDALTGGADEFLVKPCELATVRETVRRMIGPPPSSSRAERSATPRL